MGNNQLTHLGCHIDSTIVKPSLRMVSNLKPVSDSCNQRWTWEQSENGFGFMCQSNAA